jgi:diguanylate cyclase (GGDEF)-like protein
MPANNFSTQSHYIEHHRSYLSLRWLLIILGSYLSLFPRLGSPTFVAVFSFAIAFAVINLAASMIPRNQFDRHPIQVVLMMADIAFVAVTFYLLRGQDSYLYLAFVAVFLLAVVWRDLQIVVFSILIVSVLYGVFTGFRMVRFELDAASFLAAVGDATSDVEQFLTLSMFFLVAVFYLFMTAQIKRDAELSTMIVEEKQRAEVLAEITRSLSSSLKSHEILYLIVTRLCEVTGAVDCSIVRIDANGKNAKIMVKSTEAHVKNPSIEIGKYPELMSAHESRKLQFVPDVNNDGKRQSVIAVPMVSQDTVLGLIHLRFDRSYRQMSETNMRFLNTMAGSAANALRNAQLFEEMEHYARTDFLTGLPNHRSFQSQLSSEWSRAQRHNNPLSLLMIDLDFLKSVNDHFGHPAGDMVIRGIGETIRSSCREFDFAARYGGEEFTVILPETPLDEAMSVAERIRVRIAEHDFPGISAVTASIGVSNYPSNAFDKQDLIRLADDALYVAKKEGRDRVSYLNDQLATLNPSGNPAPSL